MVNEVKESILNAYESKTGLSRLKLSHMMDDETWFNVKKAVKLGFADRVLFEAEKEKQQEGEPEEEERKRSLRSSRTRFCIPENSLAIPS